MKQRLIIGIMLLTLIPSKAFSQKWLENLGKVLETADAVLNVGEKHAKQPAQKNSIKQTLSTESSALEVTSTIGDVNLSRPVGTFQLITHHPDFSVRVKRCVVSGRTCFIDMILENLSDQDVYMKSGTDHSVAYDDEANQYTKIRTAIGDINARWDTGLKLMAHVPVKARITIQNVSPSATEFRRLEVLIYCRDWGFDHLSNKRLTFKNLPITRDGDM